MSNPDLELDAEAEEEELPSPGRTPLAGGLPRFPTFNTRNPRPPSQEPATRVAGPPAEGSPILPPPAATQEAKSPGPDPQARSSRASTEPPEEPVDPRDLQAAVGQAADIGFVLFGQALGRIEARARQHPSVDPKWVPTRDERRFVAEPAARIAKRHIKTGTEAMDVIDGCLVAVGMGAFAVRGLTGVEPLEQNKENP